MALSTNSSLNALPPIPIDPQDFIGLRFFLQALEDQVVKAINPNPSIPTGVTGLKVTAMNLGNLVAWNQSTNSEGYIVWRNISNNFTTATIIAQLAGIGNASAFDSVDQTAANQTRYYWVAPFNGNGIQGPLSAAVSSNNFAGDPTSTFVGVNAKAAGVAAVAVGQNASAPGLDDSVIGQSSSTSTGGKSTVVGQGSSTLQFNSTVVGQGSSGRSINDTIVGQGSATGIGGGYNTILGQAASSDGNSGSCVAIGAGANITGGRTNTTVVGRVASGSQSNGVAIGYGAVISGLNSTVIGAQATDLTHANCIVIGQAASATAASQCVIGAEAGAFFDMYIGRGVTQTGSTQTTNLHASDGSGSNIAGDSLALYGGRSTGNAAGGNLDFYTTPAGGAGSGLNTAVRALRIDSAGVAVFNSTGQFTRLGLGAAADATASAYIFGPGVASKGTVQIQDSVNSGVNSLYNYISFYGADGTRAGFNGISAGDYYIGHTLGAGILRIFVGNTERASFDNAGLFTLTKTIANYNSINTVGWGVPAIYGAGRLTAQTAGASNISTYTVGSTDGSFTVSANILITAFTAGTVSGIVHYTDEGGTARTLTLNFSSLGGVISTTPGAAGAFEGFPLHVRAKANTGIEVATTVAVFTGTYNVEGYITQTG